MKNKSSIIRIIFFSFLLYSSLVHSQDVGATFCWHYQEIYGGHRAYPNNNSIVTDNLPFLDPIPPGDRGDWHKMRQWWENMAEEINYSGLDYVALLSRGDQKPTRPDNGNGNPVHIQKLVTAMTTRGANNFKLAIFDDCPNSWTSSRNYFLTGAIGTSPPFDCGDVENYKYIWDMNLKKAIAAIPDEKRYKIDGRMVIFFWSVKTKWMSNITGNLSKILAHIRTECTKEFGFNPYLIVDGDWFSQDVLLKDSDVDAEQGWFSAANKISYTLRARNNIKIGALAPGFLSAGEANFLDPSMGTADRGKRLKTGLDNTVKLGARTTLLEGFTDSAESAALWRSEDNVYYDYPNQRLNIIRSYTSNPYPISLKMEAEACDFYNDLTAVNTGGKFLKSGSLDVVDCTDTNIGWNVTNTQASEWMEWRELPLLKNTKFLLRYKSSNVASVNISVDGSALSTINLPNTNDIWTTVEVGDYLAANNGLNTVRLTIESGSPDINYFLRVDGSSYLSSTNFDSLSSAQDKPSFYAYPNPYSDGNLFIDLLGFQDKGNVQVRITNLLGQTVFQKSMNNSSKLELNLSGQLNESIYFISIESGKTQVIKKLLVK